MSSACMQWQIMTLEWAEIVSVTGKEVPASYGFFIVFLVVCGLGKMLEEPWAMWSHCVIQG